MKCRTKILAGVPPTHPQTPAPLFFFFGSEQSLENTLTKVKNSKSSEVGIAPMRKSVAETAGATRPGIDLT